MQVIISSVSPNILSSIGKHVFLNIFRYRILRDDLIRFVTAHVSQPRNTIGLIIVVYFYFLVF
jgi:hypothetical protein